MNKIINNIADLSDNELYQRIKNTLVNDYIKKKNSDYILELLFNESSFRNANIYQQALKDSEIIIDHLIIGKHALNFASLEFMNDTEIDELFSKLHKDSLKEHSLKERSFEDIFRINQKDLIICEVEGESMIDANIHQGDVIIAEKNSKISDGDFVIVLVNNQLLVKEYRKHNNDVFLVSKNQNYPKYKIQQNDKFQIIGKVRKVIKSVDQYSG